jgi:hypothetical protein
MKYTYRPTGKNCPTCKGAILESFAKKDPEPPNHLAPERQIHTTGFYCEKCGLSFGGPLFKESNLLFELTNELLFELNFHKVMLTRNIKPSELPFSLGNDLIKKALKMTKGDTLYFSYADKDNRNFSDQSCFAGYVRLEPNVDSPPFLLKKDFFGFQPSD